MSDDFKVELRRDNSGLIDTVVLNGIGVGTLFRDTRKFVTTVRLDDDEVQRIRVEIDKLTDRPVSSTAQVPEITEEEMYGDSPDEEVSSIIIP